MSIGFFRSIDKRSPFKNRSFVIYSTRIINRNKNSNHVTQMTIVYFVLRKNAVVVFCNTYRKEFKWIHINITQHRQLHCSRESGHNSYVTHELICINFQLSTVNNTNNV